MSRITPKHDCPKYVEVHHLSWSLNPDINDFMLKILFFKAPYDMNRPYFNDASSVKWKTMLDNGSHVNRQLIKTLFFLKLISAKGYTSVVSSPPSLQLLALRSSNQKQRENALPQLIEDRFISSALDK